MQRLAYVLLSLFAILLLLILGLVGYVQVQESVTEGALQREADPRVFFGEGISSVDLTHRMEGSTSCPATHQTTNIILLLDKSISMKGEAFGATLDAARQFIRSVDLDTAYVSIAFFDEHTVLSPVSTQDKEVLTDALIGYEADGSRTNIYEALSSANTWLAEAPIESSAAPVIILLSDGGEGADPAAVSNLSTQLKANDIRIITIALGDIEGSDEAKDNAAFLESLASSSSDYYQTPDPDRLQSIYVGLAKEINEAVAVDIVVQEHVNPDLTILLDSISPEGTVNNHTISWEFPSMSADVARFSYQVAATGIGLQSINEEAASMIFTHCVTGVTTNILVAGPSLLRLPSPVVLLLALLPLLFLPIFLLAWFRRAKEPERIIVPEVETPPPPLPTDINPAWIKRLGAKDILTVHTQEADDELTPTVIIGIGAVGRVVLSQMAQTLKARYGGKLPSQLRLLQIDVQPEGGRSDSIIRPAYLDPEEWVLLEPNLGEVKRLLQSKPDDWPHLSWYKPWETSGRMQGRMGVFYDLRNGAKTSVLWNSLSRAAHQLDRPRLRLVGSTFDDVSSGMLVDIARLVQIITNRDVDVELWLSGPVGADWSPELSNPRRKIRQDEQKIRTLATLRELERFQRNARVPFHYVSETSSQDQLHDETQFAVVQTLFLFEPSSNKAGTVEDHLATIADSLLAIIHTPAQQAFNQHISASQSDANRLTNRKGVGTVCSLGAYSVRMPLGSMEEALTWRLIYDLLFERELGLLPMAEMQSDGAYKQIDPDEVTVDNVRERKAEATALVDKYIYELNRAGFGQATAVKVSHLLNGEDGKDDNPFVNRVGGLLKAENWLKSLKSTVRREGEREVSRSLGLLSDQAEAWQAFLEKEIRPFVFNKWEQSRRQLEAFSKQNSRHWVIADELEWPIYQQRLRPTIKQTAELQRAAQRFGWHVRYHENSKEWHLDMIMPLGNFVWEDGVYIEQFKLEQNLDSFVSKLYKMVYPLVHNQTESEYAMDEAARLNVTEWLKNAEPRLSINELEASRDIATNEVVILVAPNSRHTVALQQEIQNVWQQSSVNLCKTEDNTAVTLLHVRDRVPLTSYEGYNEEAWQTDFVEPNRYVWRGEQIAAEIETESGQIDSAFRGWIEQDKQKLDLFAQSVIYGVLGNNGNEWHLPGWGAWRGDGLGGAIEALFDTDISLWPKPLTSPNRRAVKHVMDELEEVVANRRREVNDDPELSKRAYLRKIQTDLIDPLLNSVDTREKYLALYMQHMMQDM